MSDEKEIFEIAFKVEKEDFEDDFFFLFRGDPGLRAEVFSMEKPDCFLKLKEKYLEFLKEL